MNSLIKVLASALLLSGCGGSDKYAENAATPNLPATSEAPGDWSQIMQMVGRPPDESGLLERSSISVDLNALLGPDVQGFRSAMAGASPLIRDGEVLVTVGGSRQAFLVILPADHALEAGLRADGGWRTFRTPGAEIALPPSVQALLRR